MPDALRRTIAAVDAEVVVVSYNDESWVGLDELRDMCAVHGDVAALAFDSKRYVGAQIGIHNPDGRGSARSASSATRSTSSSPARATGSVT